MRQLLLATHNRDKVREMSSLLSDLGVEVLSLDAFPAIGHIAEDAETLLGNALLKATAVGRQSGLPSLGDDTGLEVYYLNDAPGVYSSRYSGENATYAENVALLLANMRGVPPRRRAARFRCVLAFAPPGREPVSVEGILRGTIIENPRGKGGFGYDPVFLPEGRKQTLAEMDLSVKNTLSHRALAMRKMIPILRDFYK